MLSLSQVQVKFVISIILSNHPINPMTVIESLPSIYYRWGNWGIMKWNELPEVTWQKSGRARTLTQLEFRANISNQCIRSPPWVFKNTEWWEAPATGGD